VTFQRNLNCRELLVTVVDLYFPKWKIPALILEFSLMNEWL